MIYIYILKKIYYYYIFCISNVGICKLEGYYFWVYKSNKWDRGAGGQRCDDGALRRLVPTGVRSLSGPMGATCRDGRGYGRRGPHGGGLGGMFVLRSHRVGSGACDVSREDRGPHSLSPLFPIRWKFLIIIIINLHPLKILNYHHKSSVLTSKSETFHIFTIRIIRLINLLD